MNGSLMTQNVIAGPRQTSQPLASRSVLFANSVYPKIFHLMKFYSFLATPHHTPCDIVTLTMTILSVTNLTVCGVVIFVAFIAQNVSKCVDFRIAILWSLMYAIGLHRYSSTNWQTL